MTFGCQRIVAATEATITWQPTDQEGEPADPAAAVTVGVKRADGTALVADGAATTGTGDSPRAFALSRAQTAQLDVLVATWRIGATVVATTHHAIVGRRYVSLAEVRQIDPTLLSTETTKNADMLRARDEVETMFEQRTGRAWVPRFSVVEVRPGRPLRALGPVRPGGRDYRRLRYDRPGSRWPVGGLVRPLPSGRGARPRLSAR
jgi:hypothetical protein